MEAVSQQKNMNGKAEGMVQTKSMDKADTKTMNNVQAGSSAAMGEGMEKTFLFKKWWFWVAVAAGIIILAFIVWFFLF